MRRLVTGSSGFVGSTLVKALVGRGEAVRAMVHKTPPSKRLEGVEYVQGDIRDRIFVEKTVEGVDIIHHCASAIPQFCPDKTLMRAINLDGTVNILKAAREKNIKRVIFLSSAQVYGLRWHAAFPCPEDAPLKPISEYGRNKLENEKACLEFQNRELEVVIFRLPLVTGPGQNEPFMVSLLKAIKNGDKLVIPGRPTRLFQTVDVRDAVEAMLLAERVAEARSEVFNLGCKDVTPIATWIKDLVIYARSRSKVRFVSKNLALAASIVKRIIGRPPSIPLYYLKTMDKDFVLDVSKAERILGWKARISMIQSNRDSYDWYLRSNPL